MPTKPKKLLLALCGFQFICALVCAFFMWHSNSVSRVWQDALNGFEFLALVMWVFFLYKFPGNRPATDPTIHLFPKSTEESPESRNQ